MTLKTGSKQIYIVMSNSEHIGFCDKLSDAIRIARYSAFCLRNENNCNGYLCCVEDHEPECENEYLLLKVTSRYKFSILSYEEILAVISVREISSISLDRNEDYDDTETESESEEDSEEDSEEEEEEEEKQENEVIDTSKENETSNCCENCPGKCADVSVQTTTDSGTSAE